MAGPGAPEARDAPQDDRHRLILVLCCLAQFMVILDLAIVNVALPAIDADLGFSSVDLQWVVNAYAITFAGFLLLGGRASDLFGRRETFATGLALLAVASLVGGLAQDQATLIGARAAQGVGSAIVAPTSLSILMTTFIDGPKRHRALGLWSAVGGAGGAAGAILGGVLTDGLSWRWVLFINVPIGLAGALATLRVVPRRRAEEPRSGSFDLAGAVTVTAGLLLLTYTLVSTEEHGWGSAHTAVFGAAAIALIGLFLVIEGRFASAPLMPLSVLRSRPMASVNLVAMCMGVAVFTMWYFLSLYLQRVLGYSAIQTGLAFVPMSTAVFVSAQLGSRLGARIGPARVLTLGLALNGAGLLLLSQAGPGASYAGDVLPGALLASTGGGLAFVSVTVLATTGVRARDAGLASGILNTARQVGGSLGLALLTALAAQRTSDVAGPSVVALSEGYQRAFQVSGAFALCGAALALVLLALRHEDRRPDGLAVPDIP